MFIGRKNLPFKLTRVVVNVDFLSYKGIRVGWSFKKLAFMVIRASDTNAFSNHEPENTSSDSFMHGFVL